MSFVRRIASRRLRLLVLVIAVGAGASVLLGTGRSPAAHKVVAAAGLHVSGNRLLDKSGRVVSLQGVNRSGPEYACVQGWGIFDGPNDSRSIGALATWHVNVVRVPINEDCWLGINGINPRFAGANYR